MMATRDYLNDHPACRATTQERFLDGTVYREGRHYDAFNALLKSIRKGDVVRVYRPFLLAPKSGGPARKRRIWAERHEAIKAKGGCVVSIDPLLRGAKLAMYAYEEIAGVARGRAGQGKTGRPRIPYTPEQLIIMEREWHSKKHTRAKALKVIQSYGIKVKRGYLYAKFPVKD